jgi:type 1 fimbria pilin
VIALLHRPLAAIALILLAIGYSQPAKAITMILGASSLPLSPGGPYTSARNKPVGTILATSSAGISANGIGGSCLVTAIFLSTSPATGNTYHTGVSGLGVNLYYQVGATRTQITPGLGLNLAVPMTGPGEIATVLAELVVTGPVSSGTLTALPTLGITFGAVGLGCGLLSLSSVSLPVTASSGTVTGISCTATNPAITVNLPPVAAQTLNAAGKTAGTTRFTVPLSCGTSGADVYVTLTDLTTPANTTSLLSLKPASTAGNVRLQILRGGGTPVSYGPESVLPGAVGQWQVGPTATTAGIPLSVQYYATGAATAGTVQAVAVYTLSYQ